ncbi:MAG: hypothetical protein L6R39_005582 [Caloplaca ligustica]|nr:MAG: hypothetical protein L6R39_005582 [Caloplaca ligustica]
MTSKSKPSKSASSKPISITITNSVKLIRTKRIYISTAVFTAPKSFCVVFIQDIAGPLLNKHLLDHIFISHYHDPEGGFANLEAASNWIEDDRSSSSSVVRKSVVTKPESSIERSLSETVSYNIPNRQTSFNYRAGHPNSSPPERERYSDRRTPLHGLNFVTPSLVDLAARKVFTHRIVLTVPDRERSLQYGSDLAAVSAYLGGVTPESIIEDVIASVETPL